MDLELSHTTDGGDVCLFNDCGNKAIKTYHIFDNDIAGHITNPTAIEVCEDHNDTDVAFELYTQGGE